MIESPQAALFWTQKLIALAIALETLELLKTRDTLSENGIWKWSILKKEFEVFPNVFQKFFALIFSYNNFTYLLLARLTLAILAIFFYWPTPIILLSILTVFTYMRWRGTVNGGSDYMTIIVLLTLAIAMTFETSPKIVLACLWYITIQTCSSYFIAGISKLKQKGWRNGEALGAYLCSNLYVTPLAAQRFATNSFLILLASWTIIIFECAFPFALVRPDICAALIGIALVFHLANFYIFGLNRFLFTWSATYPALYFCAKFGVNS